MRYSSVKIEKLTGLPAIPLPNQFYLIESGGSTELYLSNSLGVLILLNNTGGGNFSDGEIPSGVINGSNGVFGLSHVPITGSTHLFLNGLRLQNTVDYTVSSSTITMTTIPFTGDSLVADYRY